MSTRKGITSKVMGGFSKLRKKKSDEPAPPSPPVQALSPSPATQPLPVEFHILSKAAANSTEVFQLPIHPTLAQLVQKCDELDSSQSFVSATDGVMVSWNFGDRHLVAPVQSDSDLEMVLAMMERRRWRDHFVVKLADRPS